MRAAIIITVIIGLGLTGVLSGQAPGDPIQKANLIETREGDLATALDLYARAASDVELSAESRTQARYRQALVERKLGRVEAARASLEVAAKGQGEAAARAQAMLDDKTYMQDEDLQVSGRVHRAIAKLYQADTADEAVGELKLIGESAVPALAEALRNEKTDIGFVGRGVKAMLMIGGQRVAKWFGAMTQDDDVIYRRAVMDSLERGTKEGYESYLKAMGIDRDLTRLLADADLDVAGDAFTLLYRMSTSVEPALVYTYLGRLDAGGIGGRLGHLERLGVFARSSEDPSSRKELLDQLLSYVDRGDADLCRSILVVLSNLNYRYPGWGRELWFDFVTRCPAWPSDPRGAGRANASLMKDCEFDRLLPFLKRIPAEEYAAFRGLDQDSQSKSRVGYLLNAFDWFGNNPNVTDADMAAVLDVIELAGPTEALSQLERNNWHRIPASMLPRAVALIEKFSQPELVGYAVNASQTQPVELDIAPALRWLRSEAARTEEEGEFIQGRIGQMIQCLVMRRVPGELEALMRLLDADPRFYLPLCERMTKIDIPEAQEHLLTLLARSDEGELAEAARHLVWLKLFESGDARALPLLTDAVGKGLRYSFDFRLGGKKKTFPAPTPEDFGLGNLPRICALRVWSGEQIAKIVSRSLEVGGERFWRDLTQCAYRRSFSTWKDWPRELRLAIERQVFQAPFEQQQQILERMLARQQQDWVEYVEPEALIPAVIARPELKLTALALSTLRSPLSSNMREILRGILSEASDTEILNAAISAAGAARATELLDLVRRHLRAPTANTRYRAISAIVLIEGEAAVPEILELAEDADDTVRQLVCNKLALMPDRRAVPVLIELLKDPNRLVREHADEALRQIQFYFEQKDRWGKWLKGAGLDGESAAEALLAQAAADQPKDQRLVAIASLGTLGVPETLPILIGWMTDADPEIAAAAKAAVTKINAK